MGVGWQRDNLQHLTELFLLPPRLVFTEYALHLKVL